MTGWVTFYLEAMGFSNTATAIMILVTGIGFAGGSLIGGALGDWAEGGALISHHHLTAACLPWSGQNSRRMRCISGSVELWDKVAGTSWWRMPCAVRCPVNCYPVHSGPSAWPILPASTSIVRGQQSLRSEIVGSLYPFQGFACLRHRPDVLAHPCGQRWMSPMLRPAELTCSPWAASGWQWIATAAGSCSRRRPL